LFPLFALLAHASSVDLALGEAVFGLAVSPDGRHLAVADNGLLAIRDARTLALVWAPVPAVDMWRRVSWLDAGTMVATHVSGATYAFHLDERRIDGLPTQFSVGDATKYRPLRWGWGRPDAPPGDLQYDEHVNGGFPLLPEGRTPTAWSNAERGLDYGKKGTYAGDDAGFVHVRRSGALVSSEDLGSAIRDVLPIVDGVVARTVDGTVLVLDESLNVAVSGRGPLDEPATAITLDPSGRFAWVGRPGGGLATYDLKRGRVLAELPGGLGYQDVATRDDVVLVVDGRAASLWDVHRGRRLWTLEGLGSQGVQLGEHSVLLAPNGRARWVNARGRTVREVCVTAGCDQPRPAGLAVGDGDRLVVLEPIMVTSRGRETLPGRLSVFDQEGRLLQTRPIDHRWGQRPRLDERELMCADEPDGTFLRWFDYPIVDDGQLRPVYSDFAVGSDVVLCQLRLSLDTLDVIEDMDRFDNEVFVGWQRATVLTVEAAAFSDVSDFDSVWFRDDDERTLLIDPHRQKRFLSAVRWDQGRLVIFGVGPDSAGGVLRYTDWSPQSEIPPVEPPPLNMPPAPPAEPLVVQAYPPEPVPSGAWDTVEGPAGRLRWRNSTSCTDPSDETVPRSASRPTPVYTVDILDVQGRAIDGHAFPGHLDTLEGWLDEGLEGRVLVERIDALGPKATLSRRTWSLGRSADFAFEGADETWQQREERPLGRQWVRRGPSSTGKPPSGAPQTRCTELLLDDVPKGSWSLGNGAWAATPDGFLFVSDDPLFLDARGVAQPEHPVVKALGHYFLGTHDSKVVHVMAFDQDTLVVRVRDRLIWVDLGSGVVHEHVALGREAPLLLHDGAVWFAQSSVFGFGPDGARHPVSLPQITNDSGPGGRISTLWIHEDAFWAKATGGDVVVYRWSGDVWQPVVVAGPGSP
jgi:hypothetical protein